MINCSHMLVAKGFRSMVHRKFHFSGTIWSVFRYNFDFNFAFIFYLFTKILVIEEHWLNDQQLSNFGDLFPGYCVYGVTAMESSELLHGRPKGGVLVIYPDSFGRNTKVIQTHFKRLCVLNLHINDMSLYLFCLYMPIDNNKTENLNEYDDILTEISMICTQNNAEYICIAGDMNTDLSRIYSWHVTSSLLQFIENEDLYIPLYHADANVDSTYHSTSVNAFSIIDHIFVSKSLSMYITDYVSLSEEIDNESDHSPVLLTMSIDIILHSNVSQVRKPRKKWNQVNSNILCSYHTELNKCLSKIVVPNDMLYCRNMSCQCDNNNNNNNIWFKHQYLEKNISNQKCYTSLTFKSVT